jgi:hypothetical protein
MSSQVATDETTERRAKPGLRAACLGAACIWKYPSRTYEVSAPSLIRMSTFQRNRPVADLHKHASMVPAKHHI